MRIAVEQAKPAVTQKQRDVTRQAGGWRKVEDAAQRAREADRARPRSGERQEPRLGR